MIRGSIVVLLLSACGPTPVEIQIDAPPVVPPAFEPPLGATWEPDGAGVIFRVGSTHATRIELAIYDAPTGPERLRIALDREAGDSWRTRIAAADLPETIHYGYRVWGPNWPYDPAWQPGSTAGWITDVDAEGNRMNPNKLVVDPYTRELSHDPTGPGQLDGSIYAVGDANRAKDSGPLAPKGLVLRDEPIDVGIKPLRPIAEDVIYEVHLRGFTRAAGGECAGTFAGAAQKAAYLAELGITAVEFLPVQETSNDRNDVDPNSAGGDNYWGYSTLAFFAPDRRYACDRSPGGPTREWRAMTRAFHEHGIKVLIDVVYNHTAEGGGGSLLSLRGLDNAGYYQLDRAGTGFTNSNGVGADLATATKPPAANLTIDSLAYWRDSLGVDGFRFDLAPVLGNVCGPGCFDFDRAFPAQLAELFARPQTGGAGVDLIAEPWGTVGGTYQVGNFPAGWSEWNDKYRDLIRDDQNRRGVAAVTPGWLAARVLGSSDQFRDPGRAPAAGISYLVAHDGMTLRDLYACDGKNNGQAWPFGPSDGGSNDNRSWDHDGDAVAQRQAARTGLALLALSQGVPMITGGDERLRGQRCNNNPYNLDSPATWLDWSSPEPTFTTFVRRLLAFRAAHPALRSAAWIEPAQVRWRDAAGNVASAAYMDDATKPVLGWQLAGTALGDPAAAIYVIYNRDSKPAAITLPPPPAAAWYRVADTGAWMEAQANFAEPGAEHRMQQARYDLAARSLAVFIAK
ncbi:MAG: glycogen-debranching protein [Deltaproteobacteria bacterium]|nr:glycogen-debranching protein [Deltaproteobacteria bacterium]